MSLEEFDFSIAEEFTDKLSQEILSPSKVVKFLKYAEYMRNRKFLELDQLYHEKKQEEAQEMDKDEGDSWGDSDEELDIDKFITKETAFSGRADNNPKSTTSLE